MHDNIRRSIIAVCRCKENKTINQLTMIATFAEEAAFERESPASDTKDFGSLASNHPHNETENFSYLKLGKLIGFRWQRATKILKSQEFQLKFYV